MALFLDWLLRRLRKLVAFASIGGYYQSTTNFLVACALVPYGSLLAFTSVSIISISTFLDVPFSVGLGNDNDTHALMTFRFLRLRWELNARWSAALSDFLSGVVDC